jgi:hypothetical protein
VERGWLDEDAPGLFILARRGLGSDMAPFLATALRHSGRLVVISARVGPAPAQAVKVTHKPRFIGDHDKHRLHITRIEEVLSGFHNWER